jgi:tetratricopeptide (TPR) repeat protein
MLYTRGCSHSASNNHELAITDFRQVVALTPENTDALVRLGSHLFFTRRYEEALEAWLAADNEGHPDLAEWIVSALWKMDRIEEAIEWLGRSPADPRDSDLLGTRAMLLIDFERYEEALQNLNLSLLDQTIDFHSSAYSYLAMQTELLRMLNHTQEFLAARHQLETIQDHWHRSCDSTPVEVPAYVLETDSQMFRPGICTCGASVLICPDEPNTHEHIQLLETISKRMKAWIESDSEDYQDVYLRGLLTYHEGYPWREVPMDLTDGREVWVVDMNLDRVFLPGGYLNGRIIRCWTAMTKDGQFAWLCDDALDSALNVELQHASVCS